MAISKIENASLATSAVGQSNMGTGVSGTGPAFLAVPSATTTLTLNTWTKVTFGTEQYDSNSCYDTSTSRFTPNVAGYYLITCGFGEGLTIANQNIYLSINKNGSTHKYIQTIQPTAWYDNVTLSSIVYCNGTTDYIEVYAQSGSSYTNSTTAGTNWFNGAMLRAA